MLEQRGLGVDWSRHLHLLGQVLEVRRIPDDVGLILAGVVGVVDAALLLRDCCLLDLLQTDFVCHDHGLSRRLASL